MGHAHGSLGKSWRPGRRARGGGCRSPDWDHRPGRVERGRPGRDRGGRPSRSTMARAPPGRGRRSGRRARLCRCRPTTSSTAPRTAAPTSSGTARTAVLGLRAVEKAAGEIEVPDDGMVVRTSWVCGQHGGNVVKTVLKLAEDPDARWRSSPTRSGVRPAGRRPGVYLIAWSTRARHLPRHQQRAGELVRVRPGDLASGHFTVTACVRS